MAARNLFTKYCGENHHLMAHHEGSAKNCGVHNTQNSHCGSTPIKEHSAVKRHDGRTPPAGGMRARLWPFALQCERPSGGRGVPDRPGWSSEESTT